MSMAKQHLEQDKNLQITIFNAIFTNLKFSKSCNCNIFSIDISLPFQNYNKTKSGIKIKQICAFEFAAGNHITVNSCQERTACVQY